MAQAKAKPMTLAEYLDWEERQDARYEFVDGAVFLMAGSSEGHDTIRGSIFASLHAQLTGKPCRVHLDLKLVCTNGRARYPDIAVACGPRDPGSTRLRDPRVVIEVLSPSTRATDFMVKSVDYGSVASIETYLLVDQEAARVDVVRRVEGVLEPVAQYAGRDGVIELPEIGAALKLADIYQDVGVA